MRCDLAEAAVGIALGERPYDAVRRRRAEQVLDEPGAAGKALRRGAHAATARVAHQRRQARRPGEPHPHRDIDAEIAQAHQPRQDRTRIEAELRDEVHRKPGPTGRLELARHQARELVIGDARMAVGIARDSDLHDSAARDEPGVDRLERAVERPRRRVAVARDHEQPPHARFAGHAVDEIAEPVGGGEIAHGKMRHGLEPCGAHA